MDSRKRPSKSVPSKGPLSVAEGAERVIPFPVPPREADPAPSAGAPAGADAEVDAGADRPDVICDLGAYHRLARGVQNELDRLQRGLDQLKRDADNYRFPDPDGPSDDEPRPAA